MERRGCLLALGDTIACAVFSLLLALCPAFAFAQAAGVPMSRLDLQFDAAKAPETARVRKRIVDLTAEEVALAKSKNRNKATQAELNRQAEATRNALAEMAVEHVAQMEIAEALVRLEYGQALADRFRKDYANMLWRLEQRAKAGDARALATLGSLNRLGIVASRNDEKACEYYKAAAQKGHVAALFHAAGCGDAASAASSRLREQAAEGGHPVAQEMKGRQCLQGKPDAVCALDWLGRAAAQGRSSAMSLLGFMYSAGELVPRDDKRAFGYFMDAAALGDAAAQNNVGQMYETGRGVTADGAQAFAWYKRGAEAGSGSAQVNLARAYIEGRGTAPDKATATLWLQQAQKQGVAEATKLLEWLGRQ